jgi:hypothetical protein
LPRLRLTLSSNWVVLFNVFAFPLLGKFLLFSFRFSSGCELWSASLLDLDGNGPYEAQ